MVGGNALPEVQLCAGRIKVRSKGLRFKNHKGLHCLPHCLSEVTKLEGGQS